MLIFGGELNDFARRLMYVVLVAGILLGATQIVGLFGASGASIGVPSQMEAIKPVRGGPAHGEPGKPVERARIHRALSRPTLLSGLTANWC